MTTIKVFIISEVAAVLWQNCEREAFWPISHSNELNSLCSVDRASESRLIIDQASPSVFRALGVGVIKDA